MTEDKKEKPEIQWDPKSTDLMKACMLKINEKLDE